MGKPMSMQRNVFDWEHFFIYLSGPIDFDPSGGRGWRDDWTDELVDIGFKKKQILNPCRKPLHNAPFDLDNEGDLMRECRSRQDWKGLCSIMSQIVHIDLRLVDKSDAVLVNFPKHPDNPDFQVPTYGTIHELVVAKQQRKPIFLVWEGGKQECSAWLMWMVGEQNVFGSFEELKHKLAGIADGKIAYNAKDWLLLDFDSV